MKSNLYSSHSRYMLGHDQKTLRPYALKSEESSNRNNDKKNEHERIDRDRLSWTCKASHDIYERTMNNPVLIIHVDCYMFDRR